MKNAWFIRLNNLQIGRSTLSGDIGPGQLSAVIGPNRSGKTLLADILRRETRVSPETANFNLDAGRISYSAYSAENSRFSCSDF